ncbi:hypothetical protein T11_3574 [Trichinella zimbabwensis]|uniref:Uncharacterized protein n=1 Tax=Trichinella zimbabwensis TaxID=268475 RepID=A0A0V1GTB1_9BILA|nr:hypothetical protein T11_3574 [Trichinella zimbabwensis]
MRQSAVFSPTIIRSFCAVWRHFPKKIYFLILRVSAVFPQPTLPLIVRPVVDFPQSTSLLFVLLCCVFPPKNSAVSCTARCPFPPYNYTRFLSRPESFFFKNLLLYCAALCYSHTTNCAPICLVKCRFPHTNFGYFFYGTVPYSHEKLRHFSYDLVPFLPNNCAWFWSGPELFFTLQLRRLLSGHESFSPKKLNFIFLLVFPVFHQPTPALFIRLSAVFPTKIMHPFCGAWSHFHQNIYSLILPVAAVSPQPTLPLIDRPVVDFLSSTALPFVPLCSVFPPNTSAVSCRARCPFPPYNYTRFLSCPESFSFKNLLPHSHPLCCCHTTNCAPICLENCCFPQTNFGHFLYGTVPYSPEQRRHFSYDMVPSLPNSCARFWSGPELFSTLQLRRLLSGDESFSPKKLNFTFLPVFAVFHQPTPPLFSRLSAVFPPTIIHSFCAVWRHFPKKIYSFILPVSAVSPQPTLPLIVRPVVDFPQSTSLLFVPLCCVFPPKNSAVSCTARCPFPPYNYTRFLSRPEWFFFKNLLPYCHALCCSHTTNCAPICLPNCHFPHINFSYFLSGTVPYSHEKLRHFSYDLVPFRPNNCARFWSGPELFSTLQLRRLLFGQESFSPKKSTLSFSCFLLSSINQLCLFLSGSAPLFAQKLCTLFVRSGVIFPKIPIASFSHILVFPVIQRCPLLSGQLSIFLHQLLSLLFRSVAFFRKTTGRLFVRPGALFPRATMPGFCLVLSCFPTKISAPSFSSLVVFSANQHHYYFFGPLSFTCNKLRTVLPCAVLFSRQQLYPFLYGTVLSSANNCAPFSPGLMPSSAASHQTDMHTSCAVQSHFPPKKYSPSFSSFQRLSYQPTPPFFTRLSAVLPPTIIHDFCAVLSHLQQKIYSLILPLFGVSPQPTLSFLSGRLSIFPHQLLSLLFHSGRFFRQTTRPFPVRPGALFPRTIIPAFCLVLNLFLSKGCTPFVMLRAVLTQSTALLFVQRIVVFPKPISVISCPAQCRFPFKNYAGFLCGPELSSTKNPLPHSPTFWCFS